MFWYSLGIWSLIENYFKMSYKVYLQKGYEKNMFQKSELSQNFESRTIASTLDNVSTLNDYFNYLFLY